jgi:putative glutamine amidotransferase
MYPDPGRSVLASRTLHYAEDNMVQWVVAGGAAVFAIPAPRTAAADDWAAYADALDGLVLQGGADLAPQSYGETPLRPEWAGDPQRDAYELDLLRAFIAAGRPVLGICRGCQLINVSFGGTLYQDIAAQRPEAQTHRDDSRYEALHHRMTLEPASALAALYPGSGGGLINSIHHQGIKDLGRELEVEARSDPDGLVEAVRWQGASYVRGIQWHPELIPPGDSGLLSGDPLRADFLRAAARARA